MAHIEGSVDALHHFGQAYFDAYENCHPYRDGSAAAIPRASKAHSPSAIRTLQIEGELLPAGSSREHRLILIRQPRKFVPGVGRRFRISVLLSLHQQTMQQPDTLPAAPIL